MEIVLLLVVIVFLFIINGNLRSSMRLLDNRIKALYDRIYDLERKILESETKSKAEEPIFKKEPEPVVEETPPEPEVPEWPSIIAEEPVKETISEPEPEIEKEEPSFHFEHTTTQSRPAPRKNFFERFREKNPDLEKFIGENLINKIGILILVLGVSFFVKYAIDKDWINEPARVGIGILTGALVMFVAHRLRKNYAAFSSVLVAGAISIFYFTIYIAFHEYQLFSQTIAFGIMVLITVFSVFVSVSYDRQELAVLSLIGGFAAPFLVSTGEGNYIVLFSYIAILNLGILTISYLRKWKIVTILAFLFTTLIYSTWIGPKLADSDLPHSNALLFATIFYFIFSITIVMNNLRNKGIFTGIEYFILIVNTFFFFGMGTAILRDWESNYDGLFTLLLAVYNIIYAAILFKKFGLEKNAVYVLIGLAMTFVTLTIPIQFEGNQITLFWAAEAVLLLWLAQRSGINSFRQGSVAVIFLSLVSLVIDWERYLSSEELSIVANPLFLAGVTVSASLYVIYWISRNEEDFKLLFYSIPIKGYRKIILAFAVLTTYFTGLSEVTYQAYELVSNHISSFSFPVAYHMIFLTVLLVIAHRINKEGLSRTVLLIGFVSIIFYLGNFHFLPTKELSSNYTAGTASMYAFYFHYAVVACLGYFLYSLYQNILLFFQKNTFGYKFAVWFLVFVIVFASSNEVMIHSLYFFDSVDLASLNINYPLEDDSYRRSVSVNNQLGDARAQIVKIGYPILWGVLSFVFLIIGIRKQLKNLRIISLSLLGLTIVKLFVYDIQNVSETGKIIAFVLLGVLILIISFVYQRIKKLVVDEASNLKEESNEEE